MRSDAKLLGYPWDNVRALELPTHDYAIFGSAPLLAHGLIHSVNDIDLIARGQAWESARRLGTVEVAPRGDKVIWLDGGLEIFNAWLDLDADAIIHRTEIIDGLPIADLRDVLHFKQSLNRPKDKDHIERLESFLR